MTLSISVERRRGLARRTLLSFSTILCSGLVSATGLLGAAAAQAESFSAVPNGWRLQDYLDGAVILWYTGSSCSSGYLQLPASAPEGSKDRLWSTIMAAKIARQPVDLFYHVSAGTCVIDSFDFKETG